MAMSNNTERINTLGYNEIKLKAEINELNETIDELEEELVHRKEQLKKARKKAKRWKNKYLATVQEDEIN